MAEEIERKFLLENLPEALKYRKMEPLRQGYLAAAEGREVRVRQKGRRYYQTVKIGSGLRREEIEISLTRRQFHDLWQGTAGARLEKTRYVYLWQGYSLEIDKYHGVLEGLYSAEVEFKDTRAAAAFPLPRFFREEITFDPRYKNQRLAEIEAEEKDLLLASGIRSAIIGTIPYIREGEEKKVVLITQRKGDQWIFPKGRQEEKMSYAEVALLEAEEEAGLLGTITAPPIRLPYSKGDDWINLLAFPMEVSKVQKSWREGKERKRKILSLREAYELSDQPAVLCGLRYLEHMV